MGIVSDPDSYGERGTNPPWQERLAAAEHLSHDVSSVATSNLFAAQIPQRTAEF